MKEEKGEGNEVQMEKIINFIKNTTVENTGALAILASCVIILTTIVCVAQNYIISTRIGEALQTASNNIVEEDFGENAFEELFLTEDEKQEVLEAEQSEEEQEEEKEEKEKETSPYYIKVNYRAQTVTIYGKDSNGEYTVPVKALICSTGIETPTGGVYPTLNKWRWKGLMGNVYGQYSTQIVRGILFHSVPYLTKGDKSSLEWWAYDRLGTYASAGCVRLTVEGAKWIYENCPLGTKVEFYASSNPGPLGKPSAQKISDKPDYVKGWDPTDPDPDNPWRTYVEEPEPPEPEPEPNPEPPTGETDTNNTADPELPPEKEPEEPEPPEEPEKPDVNEIEDVNTTVNEVEDVNKMIN